MGWVHVKSKDELEEYFKSIIPRIREVARGHGYAIGVHGSMRRDLDLIAVPWVEEHSDKQTLADAIQHSVCDFIDKADTRWEEKPCGRSAVSLVSCWPEWEGCYGIAGLGHIDLSVIGGE